MHPAINQDIAKLYLQTLYREAEENRLITQARKAPSNAPSLSQRLRRAVTGLRTLPRTTAIEQA